MKRPSRRVGGTASAVNATNYFGANGVFARKSGSSVNVLYKNGHGDTVLLTNGNTVVCDYDYDAYGKEKGGSSADLNPFRYSGEYFDSETGFIYLRNRYYDPSSARFISEDPIRDGLNWYAYCGGNPIKYADPSGLVIKLVGTEDEMQKSFGQLQALTNDELNLDSDTGIITITNTGNMNTDKKLTAGSKMVGDLIANDSVTVSIDRIYEKNDGCYCYQSSDSEITVAMNDWDEDGGNWGYMVSDGNGGSVFEDHADVAHIILGHELIHATHYINGTEASPSKIVYRYTNNGLVADIRGELNMAEEYGTVGLSHVVEYPAVAGVGVRRLYIPWPGSLNENTLRAEQMLTKRTEY